MFSICKIFGNSKVMLLGLALFLLLCFAFSAPLFAQPNEQGSQNSTAAKMLQIIADKFTFAKLGLDRKLSGASANSSGSTNISGASVSSGSSGNSDNLGNSGNSALPTLSNATTQVTNQAPGQVTQEAPAQLEPSKNTEPSQQSQVLESTRRSQQVAFPEPKWEKLEDGLENTLVSILPTQNATQEVSVNVLRIEPEKWDFELLMASEHGRSKPLGQWAKEHELVAAINASMYLPDGKTSTGYMRRDEHINNGRVVTNFGAFFVAMPENSELTQAAVLDRHDDSWQDKLEQYKIVVQNYRLMTPQGKPLWGPDLLNSLAAIGQDKSGRILFLHCGQPVSAIAFVEGLTRMPFDLVRLMYVEGGHQAAMLVDTEAKSQVWMGKYAALLDSNATPPLPNVIGVKRKSERVVPKSFNTNATIE